METLTVRQLEVECRNVGIDPKIIPSTSCGGLDAYKMRMKLLVLETARDKMEAELKAEKEKLEAKCKEHEFLVESWSKELIQTKNTLLHTQFKLQKLEESLKHKDLELADLKPPLAIVAPPADTPQPGQDQVVKTEHVVPLVPEVEEEEDGQNNVASAGSEMNSSSAQQENGAPAVAPVITLDSGPSVPEAEKSVRSSQRIASARPKVPDEKGKRMTRAARRVTTIKCRYCELQFPKLRLLQSHVRRDHRDGVKWICTAANCDKEYMGSLGLKRHYLVDHLGKYVTCPDCQRKLRCLQNLQIHQMTCVMKK